MHGKLSEYKKRQALNSILPDSLKVNKNLYKSFFKNLLDLSNQDLARGMLNHDKYCLVESINDVDLKAKKEKIELNHIDNIILTASLKAYKLSQENKHNGNIAFMIPPFSYAFPLLLSYHLILEHLVANLQSNNEHKFNQDSGILIVSDNIELLSHIWRTSINGVFLRDFINIYIVQSDTFKEFNFNNKSKRKKNKNDGTLPWVALYRAYRKKLLDQIRKNPNVIIVDLIPFRHRARAEQIISWANKYANHVIAIIPNFDDSIYRTIISNFNNIIPINKSFIEMGNYFFKKENDYRPNPITAFWNTQASLSFLQHTNLNINIYNITGLNDLELKIKKVFYILKNCYTKDGTLSKCFKRLKDMLIKLISIPISLEWYERTRLSEGKPTIKQLINSSDKIPVDTLEEERIKSLFMPHMKCIISEIYNFYSKYSGSLRGEVVYEVIKSNVKNKKKITVIVADKLVSQEFKIWLRTYSYLDSEDLSKIYVITQSEWARKQVREIYDIENDKADTYILVNPWSKKYLSSFYFPENSNIYIICKFYERKIIDYQINKVFRENFVENIKNTFENLFNIETNVWNIPKLEDNISVRTVNYKIDCLDKNNKNKKTNINNVNSLFDDEKVINLLEDEHQEEVDDLISQQLDYHITTSNKCESEFMTCIKMYVSELNIENNYTEEKIIFIPKNKDLRVKRFDKDQVEYMLPLKLKKGDILIRLKQKERRELFDEILNMASNTLVMKWIEINVNEWHDMMKLLWHKFYNPLETKTEIYSKIMKKINMYGGNVISNLTIGNWVEGKVSLVRDKENLYAIAKILENENYYNRVKPIYNAMKELKGIHIKLGKMLGKIIMEQVDRVSLNRITNTSEWIDLGKGIFINTNDILETLELLELHSVVYEKEFKVHSSITEKLISLTNYNLIKEKGDLIYEQEI